MDEVFLALRPTSPIRVGTTRVTGAFLDTGYYIPGSVLRGALAEWMLRTGRASGILPLVNRMRFGNLFPSPLSQIRSLPFPMSAVGCKLSRGFRCAPCGSEEVAGHGIRDTLVIRLAYVELERLGARFPVPMQLRCTHSGPEGKKCAARMERVGGFYARMSDGWCWITGSRLIQTKVAISRRRRAAQEGLLYRVVALRPQGFFVGRVWVQNQDDIQSLEEAVRECGIGSLTTRGYGRAEIRAVEIRPPSVLERIRAFNQVLRQVWEELADLARQTGSEVPDQPSATYFTVDLLSPAVIHDSRQLPTLKLEVSLGGQRLEPVLWLTQAEEVGGWSTAWGLPKPTSLAAAMGSVYVYRTRQSPEEVAPALAQLEERGVGDRTDEGLGEMLICHPFHEQVMPA